MPKRLSIEGLRALRAGLIEYLEIKVEAEDWHAVMDAACDLREVDVELAVRLEPS